MNLAGFSTLDFASGLITSIDNTGHLLIDGPDAFLASGAATSSNSALTNLASVDGFFTLVAGASLTTNNDLTIGNGTNFAAVSVDNSGLGGSTLNLGGTFILNSFGGLTIGNSSITSATTASADALDFAGTINSGITINGGTTAFSGTAQAALNVASVAGFGQAGILAGGNVSLIGNSLLDFTSGGQITSTTFGANLTIDGADAFIASGNATSSNSALTGLTTLGGDLALRDSASVTTSGNLTVGDGTHGANVVVDSGASLTVGGQFFIDSQGTVFVGSGTLDTVGLLLNDGSVTIGNTSLAAPITTSAAGLTNSGTLAITGGSTTDTAVLSLGAAAVNSGTATIGTFGVLDDGTKTYDQAAGSTVVSGTLDAGVVEITGGTLELAAGGVVSGGIDFTATSGGTLKIDTTALPTNTISSFAPGDTIDLAAIAFDSTGSATLLAGNVLQVSEGGKTYTLNLDPGENFTADAFTLGADAGSGTRVTVSKTTSGPGSRLAFFTGVVSDASLINVVLTTDGSDVAGKAIAGDYNIEVFTSTPGALASGFQASVFVQGAQLLTNNAIQAASPSSTEQLLDVSDPTQNYSLIDLSSSAKQGEAIQIIGSTGAIYFVFGSAGDTITGSADASVMQVIDASGTNKEANPGPFVGPETVTGGAGNTTVWGGKGDVITGGAGFMQVNDSGATGSQTVTGGAGALSIFDIGKNFSVTGSTAGTTFFDDTYSVSGAAGSVAIGGGSSIVGGSGTTLLAGGENTEIVAAAGDAVTVGGALTYVNAQKGATTITGGSGSGTGTVEGASGYNTNILAGKGDVITLNAAAAYIDATAGSTTITGGAGKAHVEAGNGDAITGGPAARALSKSITSETPTRSKAGRATCSSSARAPARRSPARRPAGR